MTNHTSHFVFQTTLGELLNGFETPVRQNTALKSIDSPPVLVLPQRTDRRRKAFGGASSPSVSDSSAESKDDVDVPLSPTFSDASYATIDAESHEPLPDPPKLEPLEEPPRKTFDLARRRRLRRAKTSFSDAERQYVLEVHFLLLKGLSLTYGGGEKIWAREVEAHFVRIQIRARPDACGPEGPFSKFEQEAARASQDCVGRVRFPRLNTTRFNLILQPDDLNAAALRNLRP
jgi:hypothetical protein